MSVFQFFKAAMCEAFQPRKQSKFLKCAVHNRVKCVEIFQMNLGCGFSVPSFQMIGVSLSDVHKVFKMSLLVSILQAVNSPAFVQLLLATSEFSRAALQCFTKLRWLDLNRPQMSSFNSF